MRGMQWLLWYLMAMWSGVLPCFLFLLRRCQGEMFFSLSFWRYCLSALWLLCWMIVRRPWSAWFMMFCILLFLYFLLVCFFFFAVWGVMRGMYLGGWFWMYAWCRAWLKAGVWLFSSSSLDSGSGLVLCCMRSGMIVVLFAFCAWCKRFCWSKSSFMSSSGSSLSCSSIFFW